MLRSHLEFDITFWISFLRRGITAEAIAKWVKERTEVSIEVIRPPNYTNAILLGLFLFAVSGTLLIKGNSLDFLYKWKYWAVTSMVKLIMLIIHHCLKLIPLFQPFNYFRIFPFRFIKQIIIITLQWNKFLNSHFCQWYKSRIHLQFNCHELVSTNYDLILS